MSGFAKATSWAGLAAGALTLGAVAGLLANTLRPASEIRRYAQDIHDAAEGIVANLEGAGQLARTRELAVAVPGLAVGFLGRMQGGDA